MFNKEQMRQIETVLNGSEYFKRINEVCKKLYEEKGIEPSYEEYEALRGVLITKAILEDQTVLKTVSNMVYESIN